MKKYSLISAAFLLAFIFPLYGAPSVIVKDYRKDLIFNNEKVVLIQKGDNPEYRELSFDDSSWEKTSLPSDWSSFYGDWKGICWYRIHVRFPSGLPEKGLGVRLGIISDADETYFNGTLIGKSGSIDSPPVSAYDKIRVYELPTALIRPGEDNVIAMRVRGLFPGESGAFSNDFRIGPYQDIFWNYISKEIFDLIFVVIYFVVGVYFGLFFLRRRQDRENLFFSLFCVMVGNYLLLRTQFKHLFNLDFYTVKKIEYMILSLLVILFIEFIMFYFKQKHRLYHKILIVLSIIPFFMILFSGSFIFWDKLNLWYIQPLWIVLAGTGIFILITRFGKNNDARLMGYTIFILLASVINDILVTRNIYQFTRMTGYGFFFFIGSIAIILDNKFVRLHSEVEDLNVNLENRVEEKTEKLLYAMEEMEAAKRETDNILLNVQEGIFLLDKNLHIGPNHSSMLELIFNKKDLSGANFIDIMKDMIQAEEITAVKDFIDLFIEGKVAEKRLMKLNPLQEIRIQIPDGFGFKEKYLRFSFNRILERGENVFLLVTVQDATEEKELEKRIKDTEQKAQREMELLFELIHINPQILKKFVKDTNNEIKRIEENLEKAQFSTDLKGLLAGLYRSVHAIKGDAGQLGLEIFSQRAHGVEETIQFLTEKKDLVAVDLISLLYSLVHLKDPLKEIESLVHRLSDYQSLARVDEFTDREILIEAIIQMVSRVAGREGKKVTIDLEGFHLPAMNDASLSLLKKIIIQIAKNSVSHGIETPNERGEKGKPETGKIAIRTENRPDGYDIIVHDDGRGIQLDAILSKAVSLGKYDEEELKKLPREKIAMMIFDSGLSTQHDVSIDSGRGVGLDIVKTEIQRIGGKISLKYSPDRYTEFRIFIPIA